MRKLDIARRIHQQADLSEEEAAPLLDRILELLTTTLQKGESISIVNFGVFKVWDRASRKGRNPQTGEEVMIAPRRAVTFRASRHLKAEVDSGQVAQHEALTRTALERLGCCRMGSNWPSQHQHDCTQILLAG